MSHNQIHLDQASDAAEPKREIRFVASDNFVPLLSELGSSLLLSTYHAGKVAVVDLRQGRTVATFEFLQGVEELFDVKVLPGLRCPALRGPHLPQDEHAPLWIVPPLANAAPPART
jgi:hypothetical protein